MQGPDFSKFKKMSSDNKMTILKHKDGHELRIAHSGLSKKMKDDLDKLPIHEADGGPVYSNDPRPIQQNQRAEYYQVTGHMPADAANNQANQDIQKIKAAKAKKMANGGEAFKENDKYPEKATEEQHQAYMKKADENKKHNHKNFMENHEKTMAPKKMAEGGDPEESSEQEQPKSPAPGVNIFVGGAQPQGQQVQAAQPQPIPTQNVAQAPSDQNTMPPPSNEAPQDPALTPSPDTDEQDIQNDLKVGENEENAYVPPPAEQAPTAQGDQPPDIGGLGQQQDYQEMKAQDIQDYKNEYAKEAIRGWQDQANGHVQSKTYEDLFAKHSDGTPRGTLSKIGMMFGLLVGGAGSGLAHQPNALLSAMDNEIQNDLNAQQHSKTNAQNLLRINQANEMNKAQIRSLDAKTQLDANVNANIQAYQGVFSYLQDSVNKMPNGPAKASAQQSLGTLYPLIQGKINNKIEQAAAAKAYLNSVSGLGGASGGSGEGPVNYNKLNQLDRMSKLGNPLVKPEDISNMTSESAKLEPMRNFRKNFNSAFQELNTGGAGKLTPNRRESLIQSLAGDYSKITGYGADAAKEKMNALLPKVTDWNKTTQEEKLRNNNSMFDTLEAGVPTLKRFGVLNPYKAPTVGGGKSNSQEMEVKDGASGKHYFVDQNKKFLRWK